MGLIHVPHTDRHNRAEHLSCLYFFFRKEDNRRRQGKSLRDSNHCVSLAVVVFIIFYIANDFCGQSSLMRKLGLLPTVLQSELLNSVHRNIVAEEYIKHYNRLWYDPLMTIDSLIILLVVGIVQVAGMFAIVYMHASFMKRMSSDMRTIAMFRKSRTVQDIAAMKAMGVNSEEWDQEEEEEVIEEDDELLSPEELSLETLSLIAQSDGA